jgi:hypothetical protein
MRAHRARGLPLAVGEDARSHTWMLGNAAGESVRWRRASPAAEDRDAPGPARAGDARPDLAGHPGAAGVLAGRGDRAEVTPEQVTALAAALGLPMTPDDAGEVTHRLNALLEALAPLADLELLEQVEPWAAFPDASPP